MIPCFSFVAWSGTGKTTYLEALVAELARRGLRVAAIKHDAHRLELDREGKDSWRFARAGAAVTAVADREKFALMEYRGVTLAELVERVRDVDLVLVEGWHTEAENVITLCRSGSGKGFKIPPEQALAAVSDIPPEAAGARWFPLDDPAPLADFLAERIR